MTVIGYVQFVALYIAIGYGHNACIAFYFELQFVVGIGHTATFVIYGDDAYMLQILAISLSVRVVEYSLKFDCLTCGFDSMTGYHLTAFVGYSF